MREKIKKLLCLCITALMVCTAMGAIPESEKVYAANTGTCEYLAGENKNDQDYPGAVRSAPVKSYLVKSGTGYMRVQAGIDFSGYGIEYYNQQFDRTDYMTIDEELPIFGAFYESSDNYYIVSGQENKAQSDSVEVVRLTKYDKNWNRISDVGVYAANTTIPFYAGSCRVDTTGDYMVIRTAHEMYASGNGLNHQANMTLLINTNSMKLLDKNCKVSNIKTGYVSHSFNQFVKLENNKIVAVDHGDAYPRSIVLTCNPLDITKGSITSKEVSPTTILDIPGGIGDNNTGATVGGLEIMNSSYLVAGSSITQNFANISSKTRNVYVASVDKNTKKVTMKWLTNYPKDKDESLTRTTSNPHLIKISDDKCLVMWSRESEDKIYYATIDEKGNLTSQIYSQTGHLSDCVPLKDGNKLIWYVWNNTSTEFYTLSLSDMSLNITKRSFFHTFEPISLSGTTSTMKCIKCGKQKTGTVPTNYNVWWRNASAADSHYYGSITQMGKNDKCIVRFEGLPTSGDSIFRKMVVELADPTMGSVSMPYFDGEATITWAKEGKAVIYIYPFAVKGLDNAEKFKRTYQITIGSTSLAEKQNLAYYKKPNNKAIVFTGEPQEPQVGITGLTPNVDYTFAYENNVNAGNGKVIFTGIGKYSGTIEITFPIEPKPITSKDLKINLPVIEFAYTGNEIKPDVEIEGLTRDKDFQLTYSNNINEGLGKITIKGIGNYKGSTSKNFLIVKKSSGGGNTGNTNEHKMTYHAAVSAKCETAGNVAYYTCDVCKGYFLDKNGNTATTAEKVVIPAKKHAYRSVVTAPTCTEKGYTTYICKNDANHTYIANYVDPQKNAHRFDVYKTTSKAGFNKEGVQTATCTLCQATDTKAIPAAVVPTLRSYTFNNMKQTPFIFVKDTEGNKVAIETPYFYNETRTSVGKYQVKITLTGDKYSGYKYVYFNINPAAKSIINISPSKKAFTVKWIKPSSAYRNQITGYQIQYSTSSKMTKPTMVTVNSTTATSKKISSKIGAKKTYYVQLRTYKKIGSSYYYSAWSKVKSVKTK